MERVKELSKATQQLDAESPSHAALVAVLNEREPGQKAQQTKQSDQPEEDMKKAKEWRGRYTALQQSKKLALIEWFRLASGRRRLNNSSVVAPSLE